jgi:hypothetical protein
MMKRARYAVIALMITTSLAVPASANALLLGYSEPRWDADPNDQRLASMAANGDADVARITVNWRAVERAGDDDGYPDSRTGHDWSTVDPQVTAARNAAMQFYFVLTNAPEWANGSTYPQKPPTDLGIYGFADFCNDLAAKYPDAIGIEVWNEPNLERFWDETPSNSNNGGQFDPQKYVNMLNGCSGQTPGENIITAGPSPSGSPSPRQFWADIYSRGALTYSTHTGTHPYSRVSGSASARSADTIAQLQEARDYIHAYGGSGQPIWITEVGAFTDQPGQPMNMSLDGQRDYLANVYSDLDTVNGVGMMTVFRLVDSAPENTESNPPGYGTRDGSAANYTPKPAWSKLRDLHP